MTNNTYEYTKIRENIWQIAEDDGVCCTLVKGSELAVLIDTGYGKRNLRAFVEENVTTPYLVINSHGHPDHIGGNHWFDVVYAAKKEWDVIEYFEENERKHYELKALHIGQRISLGNLNIVVVSLAGHTKGSVGFIVQEEGILIAQNHPDEVVKLIWILNRLTGTYGEERIEFISSLNDYELLIIDDLGVERGTGFALEQMFEVIDSRCRSRKPMIITTNLTLYEMRNPPDLAYARIYDRILERCAPILFDGENFRKQKAEENKSMARAIVSA